MAGTTLKRREHYGGLESATRDLIIQHNTRGDDVELLRAAVVAMAAKLDLDGAGGGVADTDYSAGATLVAILTAGTMTAAKIGNEVGTAIAA